MEKGLFHELYKWSCGVEIRSCPPSSFSSFLHGYLSVYSMVRVYPWLEKEFEEAYDIHERIRDIARAIQELLENRDLSADTRAGYAVDLMDAYQLYSDLEFLNTALDVAYGLLTPRGAIKVVLPCRTPNICRLLCNCYYFTDEVEIGLLAGSLVTEASGLTRKFNRDELLAWWEAFQLYESVVGGMTLSKTERERQLEDQSRLSVSVELAEDEKIEYLRHAGKDADIISRAEVFAILARREFSRYTE